MRSAACVIAAALLALGSACSDDPAPPPGGSKEDAGKPLGSSFKNDVVPILSQSCALAACHSSKSSNLGIHLTYDKAQIYEELKKASPTYGGGSLKFVVPGDATKSFLMAKMDGEHAKLAGCSAGCGSEMPPEDVLPKETRDAVRKWINSGAKDD